MKCINCEKEARAVCRFCGRAVCEDHLHSNKFYSGFVSTIMGYGDNALLVEDAIWCKICQPKYRKPGRSGAHE